MRRMYLAMIAAAIVVFLAVSALLARVFSAEGAERSAITSLLQAEARGNQNAMLDRIEGCRASAVCRARVTEDVAALTHPGSVSIILLQASTGFSLTGTVGISRVAWSVGGSLPIVQCVQVRHAGDAISGLRIELLAISAKLPGAAACPSQLY